MAIKCGGWHIQEYRLPRGPQANRGQIAATGADLEDTARARSIAPKEAQAQNRIADAHTGDGNKRLRGRPDLCGVIACRFRGVDSVQGHRRGLRGKVNAALEGYLVGEQHHEDGDDNQCQRRTA